MSSPAGETGKAPDQPDTSLSGIVAQSQKPVAGLDLQYIKVAVDLQNLSVDDADEKLQSSLDSLLTVSSVDTAFIALFNDQATRIDRLIVSKTAFSQSAAEVLDGKELEELSWFRARLKHMRVVEIADTAGMASSNADASFLAERHIGSILIIGFNIGDRLAGMLGFCMDSAKPQGWDVDYRLLLKLIGTSLACGLEKLTLSHRLENIEELRQVSDICANDGIWDYNPATRRLIFSPRWKTMLGYAQDELTDSPDWRDLVHPDDLSRVQGEMRAYVDGRAENFESTHRMRHRAGGWRWVHSRVLALRTESGSVRRLVGVELDITQRKTYEEALFREKERAQITLQSIGDGVVTTDENSLVDYLNPVAEDLTGWSLEDAQGKKVDEIFRSFHEETCEPLENPLAMAIKRCRLIKTVRPTLLIRRDGNELYIESTAAPIRNGSGDVSGGVLVFHDVSESRELNRKLSYHASHDILTGLVNRREFENKLERALKAAQSRDTSYALCYLDLDQFKIVNDTCGHSAGDALLGQLGALLKSRIRWRDTVARLGGDEFGVLLESCSLDEAVKTAEDLRETVKEFRFVWEDRAFRLGVSIGIVPISSENQDVAALLSAADSACAAAKEAGRNRIHCYQENDIDLMRRRKEMQWAARINNALEENRFELFRQTIMPLQNNDTGSHYEILLRMRDENGHIVAPDSFISAAERFGITPAIDRWVIKNTFRWLVSEADERERLAMCSINLSGLSIGDDKFLPFVTEQLQSSGLDAEKICFEITETAAIASYSQANRFIQALKEFGCRFALDDFGTGLSSFGYLKHFPVDFLKIDGSFVKEILHDPIDREMVRSINEIGHLTGKQTIAEFAENEEIIAMLKGMGVDYAQGYGVSEPKRIARDTDEDIETGDSF
ncbi:MAG: EAL domain-containing protein [Proteobacteria bacterium]|nr:EAL domain-containing protein [Pseudomonadota bacterium]